MPSPTGFTDPLLDVRNVAGRVLRAMAGDNPVDRDEIPDLLQTVSERVLRRLRAGATIDDLDLYTKQAARSVFYDWLRSKRRDREHIQRDVPKDASSTSLVNQLVSRSSLTPASDVVARDDQSRHAREIVANIGVLSAKEQAVIQLRVIEGRSSAEVAAILGYRSAAVVDMTISRIRKKLAERLPPSLMGPIIGNLTAPAAEV